MDNVAKLAILSLVGVMMMATTVTASTIVPGHQHYVDAATGYPDPGQFVNGVYESLYAYDSTDYYWDLGDGRVQGTVANVDALDQSTLTVCTYKNVYRADFGGDPFMDTGWIHNHINCKGIDSGAFNYVIVHEDNPRYTGNPDNAIWGTWEYVVNTANGQGNSAKGRR